MSEDNKSDQTNNNSNPGASDLGWRAALPDDLKNHELIKNFTKPGDAIRDYVTVKQEAAKMLKIPDDQAPEDVKNEFYAKLGRPENPDKYELAKPDELPDSMYDKELAKDYAKTVFDLGLPKQKAQQLYSWYNNKIIAQIKQQKQATENLLETLKQEPDWQGDNFKKNVDIAHNAWKQIADGDDKNFVDNAIVDGVKLGDHPKFLKLFKKLGSKISDDTALQRGGGSGQVDTSEEAIAARMFGMKKQ